MALACDPIAEVTGVPSLELDDQPAQPTPGREPVHTCTAGAGGGTESAGRSCPDLYSFQVPSRPLQTSGDSGLCLDSNLPLFDTSFCLSQHKVIFISCSQKSWKTNSGARTPRPIAGCGIKKCDLTLPHLPEETRGWQFLSSEP